MTDILVYGIAKPINVLKFIWKGLLKNVCIDIHDIFGGQKLWVQNCTFHGSRHSNLSFFLYTYNIRN